MFRIYETDYTASTPPKPCYQEGEEYMPKHVKLAIIAVVVSLFIGGADVLLQRAGLTKQDTAAGSAIGFAFGVLITAVLLFFIAKRHNWARWVFIILTGLTILLSIPVIVTELGSDFLGAISTTLQVTLQAIALTLLLLRPVGNWYKNRDSDGKPGAAPDAAEQRQ